MDKLAECDMWELLYRCKPVYGVCVCVCVCVCVYRKGSKPSKPSITQRRKLKRILHVSF